MKAIFFLVLFLMSQVSLSLDLHYCHSELTDVAFTGKADCVCLDTHHEEHNDGCHSHKNTCDHSTTEVKAEKDCCSTQTLEVENSDEVLGSSKVKIAPTHWIQEEFSYALFACVSVKSILPEKYIPPLLHRDVRVLVQSFQI